MTISANTTSDGKFEYTVSGDTVTITKYIGTDTVVNIPGKINEITVTAIGTKAFENCWELKSVSIPSSITSIGEYAFHHCTGITSFTVDTNNSAYLSEDGVLFNKNKTELIQYPAGKSSSSYSVPDSVTCIGKSAFGYTELTSISIPASVSNIEEAAFAYNNHLSNVNFAENLQVDSIKPRTFDSCISLTSIIIPDSVTSIGYCAFNSCYKLSNVKFGNDSNLTSIGESAFEYCSMLSSINIPNKVTTIEGSAFLNCNKLTSVEIPYNIQSIKSSAFRIGNLNCIFLPDKEISIDSYAFVIYTTQVKYSLNNNEATITEIKLGEGKSSVVIPDTICGYPVVAVADKYQQYVDKTNHICTDYVWTGNESQYWEECAICGEEKEGTRKDLPVITINAPNQVCRTQDTEVSVSLPEDLGSARLCLEYQYSGGEIDVDKSDGLNGQISGGNYNKSENSFNWVVYATTSDGYKFTVTKTVQILDNHDLKHISAKDATVTEEGNKE
ncbi:leucine-rich repeat protein, partial [Floccifex sp.]|uniref:leucine-rich repeat domain-containing protein n=1 Tax=Floccifex sp. TaxID=2815810 RepID=UPI003F048729